MTVLAEVAGVGARAPLGLNALQVAMSFRARLFEPRGCAFRDKRGRAVGLCRVDALDDELWGYERMLALAAAALREATAGLSTALSPDGRAPDERVPLLLAVAESGRPDDDSRYQNELLRELGRRAAVRLDDESSALVRTGQAGGAATVVRACELLSDGASHVIVGGVDSYFHPNVLEALDSGHRLHALGAEDGFVPGEGAAFVLLRAAGASDEPALATLQQASLAEELTVAGDAPNLAAAMTGLVAAAESQQAGTWVLTDNNGERHRAREWQMVALRHELFEARCDHLPEQFGDVGAASAALAMAVAARHWQLGCAPAPRALVLLSSEGTERGLLELRQP